jgi:threonine dehydrogenase-like Zn-dependent dehydrogenase
LEVRVKALWLENQVLTSREAVPIPVPMHGEALVRVKLAGVCSTDLELMRGYYPFCGIPGHEFVGEVVDCPGDDDWIGRRVVGEINITCGECSSCCSGRPNHCERRTVLGIRGRNGTFAEYFTLPLKNLHPVPLELPDEAAVFTEPLAAALEIQEQVPISPGQRVLVVGAGRLGQLVAQTLALTGCELLVVARHAHQWDLLTGRGITALSEENVPVQKMDVVIDASGTPQGFSLARQAIRPRGVIVLKSTYKGDMLVNFSSLVVDEVSLVGSRCGPFGPALRLLSRGHVNPLPLIDGRYTIAQGRLAFEHAAHPGSMKILIQPQL